MVQNQESLNTLTSEQPEVSTTQDSFQGGLDKASPPVDSPSTPPEGKPLSKRDYELAVKKALADRNAQVRQNKAMLEELNLEVAYWKAQVDLVKYRYEKMEFYLKNLDIEPKYLAAVALQKEKELQALKPESPILS